MPSNTGPEKKTPFYTLGEEITNSITHGVGAGMAIAGMVVLLVQSNDVWQVVSSAIYGASMIFLFLMSCLYHALTNPTAKKVFRVFDHTSIFFLIAGTYTPFTLVTLRGWVGWTVFGVVWGVAVVGIVLNSISVERFKKISMVGYIASGWCVIAAIVPLVRRDPAHPRRCVLHRRCPVLPQKRRPVHARVLAFLRIGRGRSPLFLYPVLCHWIT